MDNTSYENFDFFGHMADDIFADVEDYAVMENMLLKEQLAAQEARISEQARLIVEMRKRISALESAVMWCGESCFDEMSEDKDSNFVKIR